MSGGVNLNGRIIQQLPSAGANPTLTVNGRQIQAQQIRPLMTDRATASTSIQNNGLDEIIVNQNGQDYLIAGRGLNMRELGRNRIPAVQLNNQPAELVDFNNEINSAGEGAMQGVRTGWRDMADTTISAARTAVGTLGAGGSIAAVSVVGVGGIYGVVRYGNAARAATVARAAGQSVSRGLMAGGLTTMKVIGIAALAGSALVTAFGAWRGASEASNTQPNWSTLSRLTDSRTAQGGQAGVPAAPAPVSTVPVLPE